MYNQQLLTTHRIQICIVSLVALCEFRTIVTNTCSNFNHWSHINLVSRELEWTLELYLAPEPELEHITELQLNPLIVKKFKSEEVTRASEQMEREQVG